MMKADVQPSWSDHVGWTDSHGNDPAGEVGGLWAETWFPAAANGWYQVWVWSDAYVNSDSGFGGFGASSIQFSAAVPLVILNSYP
jgi:hypothetical protein